MGCPGGEQDSPPHREGGQLCNGVEQKDLLLGPCQESTQCFASEPSREHLSPSFYPRNMRIRMAEDAPISHGC